MSLKLTIELIPKTSFYNNVRSILAAKQWNLLSQQVRNETYNICQICDKPTDKLDAHELLYDDIKLIQKLDKIVALCKNCHMVKHFGFAQISGKQELALLHLMKVNKLSKKEAEKYINDIFLVWKKRSTKQWKLNIDNLKLYGIKL